MTQILIIDDDKQLCLSFSKILDQEGYSTTQAYTGQDGIECVKNNDPDLVVLDIRLPDMTGVEVFEQIHTLYPKLPVIIITAFGTTETAIGMIKQGAYDYIYKPFDVEEMLQLIEKAVVAGRCMSVPVDVNPDADHINGREALVGNSSQMLEVYKIIGRVSSTDATVLIRGESGTGKELAARAVYNHSNRTEKPYAIINCVAIPETLLESELFGYEKGAFTGAAHRRVGKIEQAKGGTVFLDEVGDLPLTLQSKFLRLLQENTIERVGGKELIKVDVRIIAATNRNLEKAVADGSFREDLYYRLSVVTLTMPPLRERKTDIPMLCQYLLARLAADLGVDNPGITENALDKLCKYAWPGNIRELMNVLKKNLIFNRGTPLHSDDIHIQDVLQTETDATKEKFSLKNWIHQLLIEENSENLYDNCLDEVAKQLITEALQICKNNRTKAAKLLGISRPTLHAKIEKYNINNSD